MPTLPETVAQLARELPPGLVSRLASQLRALEGQEPRMIHAALLQVTPQPHFRALVEAVLDSWQATIPLPSAGSVALALEAASATARQYEALSQVDMIWTGPEVGEVHARRTDQALLQVVQAAQRELLVVSFAVYKIPLVTQGFIEAVRRGVRLRICLESSEASGGRMGYDTVRALGDEVAQQAEIYLWPEAKRPAGSPGKRGVLHAKCAVADRALLFLSSANLTDYAMKRNIELGVLVQGGTLPAQVATQFERLMKAGVLERLSQ